MGVVPLVVRVTDNGAGALAAESTVAVTVKKRPTTVVYSGEPARQFSDAAAVRGTLRDAGGGALQGSPVAGRPVRFGLGALHTSAVTNATGLASGTIVLTQPAGALTLATAFAGDAAYEASADSDPFRITVEDAAVRYTGAKIVAALGKPVMISGGVTEAADGSAGNRLASTSLKFTVRGGGCRARPGSWVFAPRR